MTIYTHDIEIPKAPELDEMRKERARKASLAAIRAIYYRTWQPDGSKQAETTTEPVEKPTDI